ncbi:WRKY transcription factor 18-like [Punica granatum]|uniref:WRKY transcription factor 18-like n=1 Tax=Punica granatum TaxID=22663 RepID=A0A6P8E0T7_PUNGR|nr:WRKY transcription factor 18-like [Punica granatum]XP_031400172.1 WRKY transcription factor 18-like [Punica granatum]XP_031400173.1 WRKY transcription factor 18-like [Punica granatum]XP_031400174.1 WRKY transcription factor 18-like [Punica granatum]
MEGNRAPELPADGYEWKKYGQKFIRNIGKFRSYFKCQRANCNAKKRAEWSASEPGDLRVVYEGIHTHGGPPSGPDSGSSQGGSSADANRYNLLTQVLGDQTPPHDPSQTGHQYN